MQKVCVWGGEVRVCVCVLCVCVCVCVCVSVYTIHIKEILDTQFQTPARFTGHNSGSAPHRHVGPRTLNLYLYVYMYLHTYT